MPDGPTLAESGLPEFDTSLWVRLLAPAELKESIAAESAKYARTIGQFGIRGA